MPREQTRRFHPDNKRYLSLSAYLTRMRIARKYMQSDAKLKDEESEMNNKNIIKYKPVPPNYPSL